MQWQAICNIDFGKDMLFVVTLLCTAWKKKTWETSNYANTSSNFRLNLLDRHNAFMQLLFLVTTKHLQMVIYEKYKHYNTNNHSCRGNMQLLHILHYEFRYISMFVCISPKEARLMQSFPRQIILDASMILLVIWLQCLATISVLHNFGWHLCQFYALTASLVFCWLVFICNVMACCFDILYG